MSVKINPQVTFTQRSQEQKDAEKKVVTGTGAVAATGAAANAKAAKSGVDLFTSSSKGIKNFSKATKTANEVAKKSTSLFSKICNSVKSVKNSILNWKYIKPFANNRHVIGCAKGLGYGFGVITLIAGAADIVKAVVNNLEDKV